MQNLAVAASKQHDDVLQFHLLYKFSFFCLPSTGIGYLQLWVHKIPYKGAERLKHSRRSRLQPEQGVQWILFEEECVSSGTAIL
jgi:hypothetical protein